MAAGGRPRAAQAHPRHADRGSARSASHIGSPPAIARLRRRGDFLRVAASGRKAVRPGLVLQAAPRKAAAGEIGLGFTASRKVGKAVERNRAKRRLREAARAVMPIHARAGTDYVIIGRKATLTRPFGALLRDLETALAQLEQRPRR